MPLIQINNRAVNLLELNKGAEQTIVMIHGMITNLSVFYFNIANELAKKYHIVLYDLKSHGLSERVQNGYTLEAMTEDLLAVMDYLNIEQAYLTGYSYGGLISLYTAINHPEKVMKIALIDTPKTGRESEEVIKQYGNDFLEDYMDNYSASTSLKLSKRQIEKNKQLFNYLVHETSMPKDLASDKDFTIKENLAKIQQETLLLYGLQSDCLKDGEFIHECILNSVFYTGEGDHNIPIQSPEWITEKLKVFFNK